MAQPRSRPRSHRARFLRRCSAARLPSADAQCPVMTVDTGSLDIRDSGQLAELTAAVMEKL